MVKSIHAIAFLESRPIWENLVKIGISLNDDGVSFCDPGSTIHDRDGAEDP